MDFNIDNWNEENLIELFSMDSSLQKSNFQSHIENKKNEFLKYINDKDKLKYKDFLRDAGNKVMQNQDKIVEIMGNLREDTEDFRDSDSKINIAGGEKVAQMRDSVTIPQTYSKPITQGVLNPTLQSTYLTWLNIDSEYRDIINSESSSIPLQKNLCRKKVIKTNEKIKQQFTSSDFTFTLDSPLKNVLELSLVNLEIDIKDYLPFSKQYGNLTFEVDNGNINKIKISEKKYTRSELETEINNKLSQAQMGDLKIILDEGVNKTFFHGELKDTPWINQDENMILNRSNFASTIDINNYIYVIGGIDKNLDKIVGTFTFFDISFPKFGWITLIQELNIPRKDFKAVIANDGIIYIIGGKNEAGEYLDSIESLNLNNINNWWVDLGDKIKNYITGDIVDKNSKDKTIINDISKNIQEGGWKLHTFTLNEKKSNFGLVKTDNDLIFIIGGESLKDNLVVYLDSLERINLKDINNNNAKSINFSVLNQARSRLSAILVKNTIYVIGGVNEIGEMNTVETYNLQITNTKWDIQENKLIEGRSDFGICYSDKNRLFIFGGYKDNSELDTVEMLDLDTNTGWELQTSRLNTGRSNFGSVKDVEENFYIIGGSGEMLSTEKYKSNVEIIWYQKKVDEYCNSKNKGKKVNSSLGWTLGFRELKTSLQKIHGNDLLSVLQEKTTSKYGAKSDSPFNLLGSKYLLLELDDFNKNRHTGTVGKMSMSQDMIKFKTPEYAKKIETDFSVCKTDKNELIFKETNYKSGENEIEKSVTRSRGTRMGTPSVSDAIVGTDTLTRAQKYTMMQIKNHQEKSKLNQYFSPHSENILYRFPLEIPDDNKPLILTNMMGMEISRKYFGPVTLERLRIKLLDNRGFPIDLNGGEISLSLLLKRLYQY